MDLKSKIIVITGATGGIGRELVKEMDKEGAKLILISKSKNELEVLIKNLEGKESAYFVCDLSDQKETEILAEELSLKYERVDVYIAAAGIGVYKPLEEVYMEDWNNSMNINVASNFILIQKLQKNMEKSDNSLVLAVGSGAGVIPMAGRSVYCATKFALRGLVLSLAEEYKRIGKPKFCLMTLGSTLTSFGPMSFEEKKREMENGKAYFTPDWVAKKLVEIIKNDDRQLEYELYPGDYGLGNWSPPNPK